MSVFYEIRQAEPPWGDYGDILWSGWAIEECGDRDRSRIAVSRTGPFVPPITHPFGHIIVTEAFRVRLLEAGFSGLSFAQARYDHVVRIDWHDWDRSAEHPPFYPETGEPEDYLLAGAHDADLAATMPSLWAWKVAGTPGLQVEGTNTFRQALHPGSDVAREHFIFWINERMKVWLERNAGGWLTFIPVTPR